MGRKGVMTKRKVIEVERGLGGKNAWFIKAKGRREWKKKVGIRKGNETKPPKRLPTAEDHGQRSSMDFSSKGRGPPSRDRKRKSKEKEQCRGGAS